MPSSINWIEFAAAVLLIELTPGPNMAWLAALALAEGRRAGLVATLGVALGLALNAMMAGLGLVALLAAEPVLLQVLRWAGVGLMLWLAYQAWRDAGLVEVEARDGNLWRHFTSGFLVNLFNTKAVLFFVVVVPPFLGGKAPTVAQVMALAAVSVGIATAVHLFIIGSAARAHALISDSRRLLWTRRVMALMMLGVASWLAAEALA